jgi:hypothetical protein
VENPAGVGGRAQKKVVRMLQRRKVYAHGNVKTLMTFFSENARRPTSMHITTEKDQVRLELRSAANLHASNGRELPCATANLLLRRSLDAGHSAASAFHYDMGSGGNHQRDPELGPPHRSRRLSSFMTPASDHELTKCCSLGAGRVLAVLVLSVGLPRLQGREPRPALLVLLPRPQRFDHLLRQKDLRSSHALSAFRREARALRLRPQSRLGKRLHVSEHPLPSSHT